MLMVESNKVFQPSDEKLKAIRASVDGSIVTGRNFKEYCQYLDLCPEKLSSLKILDVGAGMSSFDVTAERFGCEVTKLDARYSPSFAYPFPSQKNTSDRIAAYMQYLPFKDNTFDYTFALYALGWLENIKETSTTILETIRVTKKVIKICPVYPITDDESLVTFEEYFKNEPVHLKQRKISPYKPFYGLDIDKNNNDSHDWQAIVGKLELCIRYNLKSAGSALTSIR